MKTAREVSTWGISPQVRKTLARFILDARHVLNDDFRRQLVALGVRPDRTADPGRVLASEQAVVRQAALAVIERAITAGTSHEEAFDTFIADSAFTFLNRLVGLRCIEERRMLLVDGQTETIIRRDPRLGASSLYFQVRNELRADAAPREVWQEALDRAFRAVSERVGVLFDTSSEYGRLLPLQATLKDLVEGLNDPGIPPEVWAEDEVLGWVYQYYSAEEKETVYAKLRGGGRIEQPEELAAATCLYTERYMVDFVLQNTLGSLWMDMAAGTQLPNHWSYFARPHERDSRRKDPQLPDRLRDVTILDPACGSGHFLARAFDLLLDMYREEGLEVPEEIPHLILERNLHGVDIDLRAVQISALRLYLKACELAGGDFRPRRMNLVSADVVLPPVLPAQLLDRFKGDLGVQDLMRTIWSELKNAPKLGSLLHPERRVDVLLAQRRRNGPTLEHQDDRAWERYKLELLDGIRAEFENETHAEDVARRLFGQDLAKSVSLMEALTRHYDVVVANPPYAGTRNLDDVMKSFVDREYKEAKPDLYTAFIQRSLEFARPSGFVGMVTQQSWLFLRSFARLRQRVLDGTAVITLAQLGPRAFDEIAGEVVNVALFALRVQAPLANHRMTGFRLVGPKSPTEKDLLLRIGIADHAHGVVFTPKQADIQAIPETPFVYWLRPHFFELLRSDRCIGDIAEVRQGMATTDNERFLRCSWEVSEIGVVENSKALSGRWFWYAKGGRYQKWAGLEWLVVDWENDGQRIKEYVVTLRGNSHWSRVVRSPDHYFQPGLTYTQMSSGSMGARLMLDSIFADKGISVFAPPERLPGLAAYLSTHSSSLLLRVTTQNLEFHAGYVRNLPLPVELPDVLDEIGDICIALKGLIVKADPCERSFNPVAMLARGSNETQAADSSVVYSGAATLLSVVNTKLRRAEAIAALLHSIEGWNERLVCDIYGLDVEDIRVVLEETGTPVGWYPLISGYDHIPNEVVLPDGFTAYFTGLERQEISSSEGALLKRRMRELWAAAPGISSRDSAEEVANPEEAVLGAHIPIPTETLVEELSRKVKIHPVSVSNLLKELRAEGILSPLEVCRALEDWVSVALLLMLGYRWPEQDRYERETGASIESGLVNTDGIIPLAVCDQQPVAAERIRTVLEQRFGDEGAARSLEEFRSWVGRDVTDWLMRNFFRRHVQQFKQRPIAWHLKSPEGTFQAIVLYHQLSRDALRRLRDVYAGALVKRLKGELQRAEQRGDSRTAEELRFRIEDTEEFRDRVSAIEEGRELRNRIRCRWKDEERDGRPGPYAPDLDDGVKVNIRPFQETGLLARDVIKKW
jgi:hypothetical protein